MAFGDYTDARLRVIIESQQSINDLKKLRNELKSLSMAAVTGSKEQMVASRAHSMAVDEVDKRMMHLSGTMHKLRTANTIMTTQLHGSAVAGMNFGRVLQDMPYGLQGVANNIEPLVYSLQILKRSATEAGVSMKTALIGMLTGPGGLMIAVSLVSAAMIMLPRIFRETTKETINLGNAINDLLYKLHLITEFQREEFLKRQLEQAEAAHSAALRKTVLPQFPLSMQYPIPPWLQDVFGMTPSKEDLNKLYQAELEALDKLEAFYKERDKRAEKAAKEAKRRALIAKYEAERGLKPEGIERLDYWSLIYGGPATAILRMGGRKGPLAAEQRKARRIYEPEPLRGAGGDGGYFTGWETQFMKTWEISAARFANEIRVEVGKAWEDVFGEANSLFEKFMDAVISQFMGMMSQLGMAGLFSLIGMIPGMGLIAGVGQTMFGQLGFQHGGILREPVMGRGLRSGKMYSFAEHGPERVSPMSLTHSRGAGTGSRDEVMALVRALNHGIRFKSNELALVADIGRSIRKGQTL